MATGGILILEKNRLEFLLLKERLTELGFASEHLLRCTSLAEAGAAAAKEEHPTFVFADLFLPDSSGTDTFLAVQRTFPNTPIVVLADVQDKEAAMRCIHLGAQDFLVKGEFSSQLLGKTIRFATERNAYRMEMEMLKSDYEKLFRRNPVPMWVFDFATLRFLAVNPAMLDKYGYTEEEMLSRTVEDIHLKEDLEKLRALLATATPDDAMSSRGIWRHLKKDGSVLHVEIFSAPVQYQDRLAAIGTSIDVTDKLAAEETERSTRQEMEVRNGQMEAILESISDCFLLIDADWKISYWNRATERLYSLSREQVLGRNVWELFPNARHLVEPVYQRALNRQEIENFEFFSPAAGKWLAISAHPIPGGIAVQMKDLTDERMRSREVLETRNNYQALIDFTSDALWSVDPDLRLISGNQAFLGRMEKELGRPLPPGSPIIGDSLPETEVAKWKERYATALAGTPVRVRDEIQFSDGRSLQEIRLNPILDSAGKVVGVSCHAHEPGPSPTAPAA